MEEQARPVLAIDSRLLALVAYVLVYWLALRGNPSRATTRAVLAVSGALTLVAAGLAWTRRAQITGRTWRAALCLALAVGAATALWPLSFGTSANQSIGPLARLGLALLFFLETALAILTGSTLSGPTRIGVALPDRPGQAAKCFAAGALIAIPWAAFNVLSSGVTLSTPGVGQILQSALAALRPGIWEEAVFRFLFVNLLLATQPGRGGRAASPIAALLMSAFVHGYLHVPSVFAGSPGAGLGSGFLLSVVFGIPMAVLAYKKGLETAIGFHWCIDWVRFFLLGS